MVEALVSKPDSFFCYLVHTPELKPPLCLGNLMLFSSAQKTVVAEAVADAMAGLGPLVPSTLTFSGRSWKPVGAETQLGCNLD